MRTTITRSTFVNEFRRMRPDNFSYEGLQALFDYFEQYEEDTGEEVEFDPVLVCCHYNESTWQEIAKDYDIDSTDAETDEQKVCTVLEYIAEHLVGESVNGSYVYRLF